MPRIVRIINRLNLGGPTFNAALLTKYLAPEFETKLIAGTALDSEESSEFICKQMGIDFINFPEMSRDINLRKDYRAYKKIKNIIREFKPDIVHTHASKAGALGRLAAISMNVPVIVHTFHGHIFHSYFNSLKSSAFLRVERFLAKRSSAIIALSEFQKDELNQFNLCKSKKIRVIPLGFDLNRFHDGMEEKRKIFRAKYEVADDEIVITIIGRLVPVKNHKVFLQALKTVLKNTSKKIRAFIIGDGELLDNLMELSKSLEIPVTYYPRSPNKTTLTFVSWMQEVEYGIAGADIIALSSDNEGTPVSLIEAQAAGKPIVTTNVGGIENVVIKNETALLCSPGQDEMFARNLLQLVENASLRNMMALKGWDHVKNKFHYSRLVEDTRKLYMELLAKKTVKKIE